MTKYTVYFGSDEAADWEDNKFEFDNFADARDYYMSIDTASFADGNGNWIEEKKFGKQLNGKPSMFDDAIHTIENN